MSNENLHSIFRRGSRTYFTSSLFFPPEVRKDVFALYAFMRTADDFVDMLPPRSDEFYRFWESYHKALESDTPTGPVIDSFVELVRRKSIPRQWVEEFLISMEMDLKNGRYETLNELLVYIRGAAEVIGLMMMVILNLDPASEPHAIMLGRSMQYINILRDIAEDLTLGRTYLPGEEIRRFGLESLERKEIIQKPKEFSDFMAFQVSRFQEWCRQAREGFHFIPRSYRIPVATAADMYQWTARRIAADPFLIYEKKIKPRRSFILFHLLKNQLTSFRKRIPGAASQH